MLVYQRVTEKNQLLFNIESKWKHVEGIISSTWLRWDSILKVNRSHCDNPFQTGKGAAITRLHSPGIVECQQRHYHYHRLYIYIYYITIYRCNRIWSMSKKNIYIYTYKLWIQTMFSIDYHFWSISRISEFGEFLTLFPGSARRRRNGDFIAAFRGAAADRMAAGSARFISCLFPESSTKYIR